MKNLETFGLFLKEKDYQSYKLYGSQKSGYSVYINNKKTNVSDADAAKAKNGYVYFDGEVVEPKIVHLSMDEIASILGVSRAEAFARGVKTPLFDRGSNAPIIDRVEATVEMIGEKMTEFLLIERFDRLSSFDLEALKRGKRFTGFVAKDSEKKEHELYEGNVLERIEDGAIATIVYENSDFFLDFENGSKEKMKSGVYHDYRFKK
jgi:hypothetical protein|nr:MAG TPA: hypothetical protein [Caudoviricetes sp.]